MKKLINYLGFNNVIISIVENGDSVDNTRKYLENFQNYLNNKNILNKFILKKDIEDIRNRANPHITGTRLRIEFYAKLRNKCFDYLYKMTIKFLKNFCGSPKFKNKDFVLLVRNF